MTTPIHAQPLDEFNNGKWRILCVTSDGTLPVTTKEGQVDVPYRAGDVLLVDERDEVICGPVGLQGAVDLAERVLDCDAQVRTNPLTLLVMATALSAFSGIEVEPGPSAPASSDALMVPTAATA